MLKDNAITIVLWSLILISVLLIMFFGAKVLLLVFGTILIADGLLNLFVKNYYLGWVRHFPDSELDKKVFSKKTLYFLRRYESSLRFIIGGVMAFFLYYLFYIYLK